jgi:DnaJ-class molecular chaperone
MDFLGEGKKNPKGHRVEIILSSAEARNGCEIPLEVPLWVNCRRCGGNGTISGLICGLCRGRGEEKLEKKIRVRIPAGVRNGMRIEIPLKDRDLKGASLIATLKVSRH